MARVRDFFFLPQSNLPDTIRTTSKDGMGEKDVCHTRCAGMRGLRIWICEGWLILDLVHLNLSNPIAGAIWLGVLAAGGRSTRSTRRWVAVCAIRSNYWKYAVSIAKGSKRGTQVFDPASFRDMQTMPICWQ